MTRDRQDTTSPDRPTGQPARDPAASDRRACPECQGSGKVIAGIGGA